MLFVAITDWLKDNARTVGWATGSVKATLFVQSSGFGGLDYGDAQVSDPVIAAMDSLSDLLAYPGWQAAETAPETVTCDVYEDGDRSSVTLNDQFEFVCDPLYLDAVAFSLTGTHGGVSEPLLMVFRPDKRFVFGGSSAAPGIIRYSSNPETAYFISFLTTGDGGSEAAAGPIEIAVPVLGWESAHAAHVWLSPSRTNLVANPSFESLGDDGELFGWRSDAVVTRVSGGVGPGSRTHCAHMGGPGVLESNLFPVSTEPGGWAVEAAVSGLGTYRVGVLFWQPGMDPDDCFYDYEEFTVPAGGSADGPFMVHRAMFDAPDEAWAAQFRLEFSGSACWLDNILVEPGDFHGGYFDGSWPLGQTGDYRWYNSENAPAEDVVHKSYSTYYADRNRTDRTLFGWAETVGGREVVHPGLAFKYVPEGTRVVAHWDDLHHVRNNSWGLDLRIPVQDFFDKTTVVIL